ncbi:NADPH2:quinone reductase [Natronocella acetinitrilica]|uniref:NADPH2:quinone reductase n=1 Tax=Natronocella acetinitrilica TaxID=414046 RepID=A0AAE3G2J5_9GAMM|nr:NADPH2:quinone reductase [Natronocella acetinitrilica]
MKAIRVHAFGEPKALQLDTVADPKPAPGQVLVKVQAVGINPVETYIRAGQYAKLPDLPYTPGHDAAGTVAAVGEGVDRVAVGDRVYVAGTLSGAYAEMTLADQSKVHPLPDSISFQQGAGIGVPYTTAYHALFQRGHGIAGETVLIHGATGGVGIAALQLAKAAGLTVIATGGTEAGRALLADQGADVVLDHRDPKHMDAALAATGGRGVDVILEMVADANLGVDLPALAHGGRVVVIGSRGDVEINARNLMQRRAQVLGAALALVTPEEYRSAHAAIGAGLRNGSLKPVIARELKLEQAAEAHVSVMEPGARGKIVLVP